MDSRLFDDFCATYYPRDAKHTVREYKADFRRFIEDNDKPAKTWGQLMSAYQDFCAAIANGALIGKKP